MLLFCGALSPPVSSYEKKMCMVSKFIIHHSFILHVLRCAFESQWFKAPPPATTPPETWESYLIPLSPHIQSIPKPSKGYYLLWQTGLMMDGWLPTLPKVKFRLCKWDHPRGEVSALLVMGGRKQSPSSPSVKPPALSWPVWHFSDHQACWPLGEWISLLVTVLAMSEGNLLGPLYMSNNRHGGSLPFPFISWRFLPLSILFSCQNSKYAPAALV